MLQTIKKKIKLNDSDKICWYFLNKKIFLTLTTKDNIKKYILFPNNATRLFKFKNSYLLNYSDSNYFYNFLSKWVDKFYKPLQKKLFFKGLGFKFKYSSTQKNKLELKLGFSHLTTIIIPKKELKVFLIKKNRLAIQGFDYSLVGNFAEKIRMLRFPDSYNGKGFWYKNEFKILKQVKKT